MPVPVHRRDEHAPQTPLEDAIEVLSDEYACRILIALADGPLPAAELATRCEMSRPTVYRRLDRLESVGAVTTREVAEPDGPDRTYVRLVLDELRVVVGEHGVDGTISYSTST